MTRTPSPGLYLWIALAAIAGAALRETVVALWPAGVMPGAIVFVNVSGSLLIGLLWGLAGPGGRFEISLERRVALATGFLGSLTTFSMFAVDVAQSLADSPGLALARALATIPPSVAAAWLGWRLTRR